LVLNRLGKKQVEVMVAKVVENQTCLLIEELIKSVIESATGGGAAGRIGLLSSAALLDKLAVVLDAVALASVVVSQLVRG
jgi:hypothetical protein